MLGVILIVLVLYFMFPFKIEVKKKTAVKECPPHKWIYANKDGENGHLVCDRCKMLPGGDKESST